MTWANVSLKYRSTNMLSIDNLICEYREGDGTMVRGLVLPDFRLGNGEACAVTGPSGSGKTTLFHCISGLLQPSRGSITIDGVKVTTLSPTEKARWRAKHLGYVFQEPKLLPFLTIGENIRLSAAMAGRTASAAEIAEWLQKVGLAGYGERLPAKLSGGERQRASLVRALIRQPALVLADEPTASLDGANSRNVLDILLDYQKHSGCMLLCASHDPTVQNRFAKRLTLKKEGVQ